MNILFIGHATSKNRGCEAILRCSAYIIQQYIIDAKIKVLILEEMMEYEHEAIKNWEVPVEFVSKRIRKSIYLYVSAIRKRLGLTSGYPEGMYWQRNMHDLYKWADIVIAVGGDNLTESYGVRSAITHFNDIAYAQFVGKPTVVWGASIGPFLDNNLFHLAKEVLSKCSLITSRENWTFNYLKEIGVSQNVVLVADPAFTLKKSVRINDFKKLEGDTNMVVGIGISALDEKYLGISHDTYHSAMLGFVEWLIEKYNAIILLIPHVMYEDNDDYEACNRFYENIDKKNHVTVAGDYSFYADDLKATISNCHYFIGFRTHSTIAALSSFIPTIAIAYSKKAHGIFEQVYGNTNYVISNDNLSLQNLTRIFNDMASNSDQIVQNLKNKIPGIKECAFGGGDYLKSLIQLI